MTAHEQDLFSITTPPSTYVELCKRTDYLPKGPEHRLLLALDLVSDVGDISRVLKDASHNLCSEKDVQKVLSLLIEDTFMALTRLALAEDLSIGALMSVASVPHNELGKKPQSK